jgi:hypothetical protein
VNGKHASSGMKSSAASWSLVSLAPKETRVGGAMAEHGELKPRHC